MIENLPLGFLAGLERSSISFAVLATLAVGLPIWLVVLLRSRGEGALPPRRLLAVTAGLGALLTIPLLAVGVSLLLPSGPTASANTAAVLKTAALPEVAPVQTQGTQQQKPAATATPVAATPTRAAQSSPTPPPAPTQTATPRVAASATPVPTPDQSKEKIAQGRTIFERERCVTCHSVNGRGGVIAPDLAGVGQRRSAQWILDHFKDPQSVSPGTLMPRFNLEDTDFELLTAYLLALPKQ